MVVNVNKKGFMFVETIIMCAILMVGLLIIYNSFTSSIVKQKERLNYNSIASTYKLYYVKSYLKNKSEDLWLCKSKDYCPIDETVFADKDYLDINQDEYAKEILDTLDIERIFLTKCETTIPLPKEDDFKTYLDTLKSCNKYRFVAEFYDEKTKKYSYGNIEYPLESEG